MLFGSILSATDPVAVVALLKDAGASPKLTILIIGESLMNDGTAMVLFTLYLNIMKGDDYSVGDIVLFFVEETLGAPLLGMAFGLLAVWCLSKVNRCDCKYIYVFFTCLQCIIQEIFMYALNNERRNISHLSFSVSLSVSFSVCLSVSLPLLSLSLSLSLCTQTSKQHRHHGTDSHHGVLCLLGILHRTVLRGGVWSPGMLRGRPDAVLARASSHPGAPHAAQHLGVHRVDRQHSDLPPGRADHWWHAGGVEHRGG
jgi:hypothetical protein